MKNLILSFSLIAFLGANSFSNFTFSSSVDTEISHRGDDEKCKKGCKKECCAKKEEEKKQCTKDGDKKSCCAKKEEVKTEEVKKSCCKSKSTCTKPASTEGK